MAFRSAWWRLRLAQRPIVSRINRGFSQATERSCTACQSPKQVTSSCTTTTWPHEAASAPCRVAFSQQLYRYEPCRTLSTSFQSQGEEREESSSDATSSSRVVEAHSAQASGESSDPGDAASTSVNNVSVESAYVSSPRHDLAMLFTCTVCETRSAKTMSRASYETGVVIVRCPGCKNLHLIADRYGWFGEKGGVEDFLAKKGIDIRTGSDSSYEFTMEDLAGWTGREKPEKV